ncbi:shikimate dehydrogenase [Sporosarcina ureilytica]|uniref:Shikimate dehydrogenase (NADP(+)) n=1 Tax=Sporosarcina ureilytica TaxID=298596 RepID=A0A1D8JGT8_9BACL|nr:shikimate dehydrogenase [Sporosarcina ureilytica]AOV07927.1 shikimate dehydrogenase [Sporosarcina ureilytica]
MKKWYAVIGDPISQSMSPNMHDEWFNENNMNASYSPHHIYPEHLGQAVESLKLLGCSGWNVTVPHKSAIIPFLDEIDESAEVMNAVNTVEVLPDGSLRGSNTDGAGFVQSLEEMFGHLCVEKKVLVIGAGGAARGICYGLHEKGYGPMYVTNRTIEKAQQLAEHLPNAKALTITEAENILDEFGLIIQTTSVGMNYAVAGMPLNPSKVAAGTVVADIIYNPLETEFLKVARENGAQTMNGVGMFVHQGALAFEKWTGIQPNTANMIDKITEKLGGNYVNR